MTTPIVERYWTAKSKEADLVREQEELCRESRERVAVGVVTENEEHMVTEEAN